MKASEAWALCEHGKAIKRPNGFRLEKWISDKPGHAPGFDRYIMKNQDTIPFAEITADDWEVE